MIDRLLQIQVELESLYPRLKLRITECASESFEESAQQAAIRDRIVQDRSSSTRAGRFDSLGQVGVDCAGKGQRPEPARLAPVSASSGPRFVRFQVDHVVKNC